MRNDIPAFGGENDSEVGVPGPETMPEIRCEVKSLLLRNKKGIIEIVENTGKFTNNDPYSKYALVSKQSFDENNKLTGTTLEINSPHIFKALKEVVTYYPGENLDFNTKFTIEDPFMMLIHYREELSEYREKVEDMTAKMHVALLLEYLDNEAGSKGIETNAMIESGSITFPLLWNIFRPGDLVYQSSYGHARLFRVSRHGYGESVSLGKYFHISCSFVSYDGVNVGIASEELRIYDRKEFYGLFPTSVRSLSVYPLKFLDSSKRLELQASLVERGNRYLAIKDRGVKQYQGLYLYLRRPPAYYYHEQANYDGTFLPETMSGRVMIDPRTFNEEAAAKKEEVGNSEEDDVQPSTYQLSNKTVGEDINPQLCPPYVYGFSFERKEWCKFYLNLMSDVQWKENALDSLILPDPQKRLVQGLVAGHKFPDQARDEVRLKGKGLVVLLHGVPGSGKTLTAEMTAEHTHKALMNISTGELGSYQYRIESELKRLLTYASTFEAIVLLDEADIFLEARQSGSQSEKLSQNSMVAVFLRQLEYFQGIIFLTSNRVSVFDQAIKSRIHLALQYNSPGKATRRMLWAKHLSTVPAVEMDLHIEETLDYVENMEMNGREISNSITTGRTLAKSENLKLKLEHLQMILQVWSDFEKGLGLMKVESESE